MNFSYRLGSHVNFSHKAEFLIQTWPPMWISHTQPLTHVNFSHKRNHPYEFLTKPITHMNFLSDRLWLLSYGCHETRKRETLRFGNMGLSVTLENQLRSYITAPWLGYGLNGQAFETQKGQQISFSPEHSDRLWVPPSLPSEYRCSVPGVKRPGREVNHAPPMPRIRLNAACGGRHLFFFITARGIWRTVVPWADTLSWNPMPSSYFLKMEAADCSKRWYLFNRLHGVTSR